MWLHDSDESKFKNNCYGGSMSDQISEPKFSKEDSDRRYIAFSLGEEQYAIPLLQAKEFIGLTEPTSVPQSPDYYKGIINLRGQIISVIDLRTKLRLPKIAKRPDHQGEESIIILNLGASLLGVIVDSINSVLALNEDELGPAPTVEGYIKENYIVGVARKDNQLTLILDMESLLGNQELRSLKQNTKAA